MKKRILSLILALVMVLTLAGCSSDKDALVGKWVGVMDLADALNSYLAAALDAELMSYFTLSSFDVKLVFTFREDDTYSLTVDESAMPKTLETFKNDLRGGMVKYMEDMIAAEGYEMSVDEFLAFAGTSVDDLMEQAFPESMMDQLVEEMTAGVNSEGKFKANDGKLFMTDSASEDINDTMYDNYTLEGDTLTLVTTTDDMDEFTAAMYPMVFHKA